MTTPSFTTNTYWGPDDHDRSQDVVQDQQESRVFNDDGNAQPSDSRLCGVSDDDMDTSGSPSEHSDSGSDETATGLEDSSDEGDEPVHDGDEFADHSNQLHGSTPTGRTNTSALSDSMRAVSLLRRSTHIIC